MQSSLWNVSKYTRCRAELWLSGGIASRSVIRR
jgi:hypothetical protein